VGAVPSFSPAVGGRVTLSGRAASFHGRDAPVMRDCASYLLYR
jgi:hypothetical protein